MKKIFNWTFGSIFRTFGRIIAYILIGGLAWFFISGLDLSVWSDKLITSPIQNWRWVSLPKVYAKSDSRFISNVQINNSSTIVPTIGWYYSEYSYGVDTNNSSPYNQWNNHIDITFDQVTFPSNSDNFVTAIYLHNTNNVSQVYGYNAYSEGYQIFESNNVIWSSSLYYDTAGEGAQFCDPLSSNGEILYFRCPISTNTINKLVLTLKVNGQAYNVASQWFTIGIRSIFTIDVDVNDVYSLIQNDNANAQAIINATNASSQATQNAINNQTQQQHQDSQALNETITDDTPPDVSNALDNNTVAGWLPPGPIDSLVNLPLTLFNSLTNAMGGSCGALTVPLPFVDKNISIPCMSNVYGSMGFSSFFNWIGVIASAFILFSYLMKLYKWVDDTLTFRENNHLDNWGGV